jgi:RNase H-fold protein (predicted Holliday junction resolvase)
MKNYLAIDWGKAKIGVALAHAETGVAVPYAIWPVDDALWPLLKETIRLEHIGIVIVGDPEHLEMNPSEPLELFCQQMGSLGVRVERFSEMFTSKMAQNNLKEAQKKAISAYDDAEAARIMLSDWLATREKKI